MQRAILVPPVLDGAALAELKQWLAITTAGEDAALVRLLQAALDTCGAFIRAVPLVTTFEELHLPPSGWQSLGLEPVVAITAVEAVAGNGARSALPEGHYLLDLGLGGQGRFRLLGPLAAPAVAVRYEAGLATNWDDLPASLRQGIVRLAAHWFSERGASAAPPASVSALWQLHRRLRLA